MPFYLLENDKESCKYLFPKQFLSLFALFIFHTGVCVLPDFPLKVW